MEIVEHPIRTELTYDEQEAEKASEVISYDTTKELWINKKTMYIHNQAIQTDVWEITHNLGKMPNVKVVDSNYALVYGTVVYDEADPMNKVRISFGGAFSGKAYLD